VGKLTLPEHLELLLTDEPVLDLYAAGPWRVPEGLADQIYERGRELNAAADAQSLRLSLPEDFRPGLTAVAADLTFMTTYLCGECAVRGGPRADLEFVLFSRFLRGPPPAPPDPLQWSVYAAHWRPPGEWLFGDLEHRQAAYRLAQQCLQVMEGIPPLAERRQALLTMFARRLVPDGPTDSDLSGSLADLMTSWAGSATDTELTVLPELAGPVGYLSWTWEGFAAAHQRLLGVVPGTPALGQAVADLVLQAGIHEPPGALAAAIGTDTYREVQGGYRPPGNSSRPPGMTRPARGSAEPSLPKRLTPAGHGWTWPSASPGSCRACPESRSPQPLATFRWADSSVTSGPSRGRAGPSTR